MSIGGCFWKMVCEWFEKGGDSLRGRYLRSIADIPKLYAIGLRRVLFVPPFYIFFICGYKSYAQSDFGGQGRIRLDFKAFKGGTNYGM